MLNLDSGFIQEASTVVMAAVSGIAAVTFRKADRAEKTSAENKVATDFLRDDMTEVKIMIRDIHKHMLEK